MVGIAQDPSIWHASCVAALFLWCGPLSARSEIEAPAYIGEALIQQRTQKKGNVREEQGDGHGCPRGGQLVLNEFRMSGCSS